MFPSLHVCGVLVRTKCNKPRAQQLIAGLHTCQSKLVILPLWVGGTCVWLGGAAFKIQEPADDSKGTARRSVHNVNLP